MAGALDLLAGSDDYPENEEAAEATGDEMSGAGVGGLTALDIPGAAEALATLAKSSQEARSALQRARESVMARKYNRAIPLLAVSQALGAPTRTGAFGESFANMSGALIAPLREKQEFEHSRQKELLGIDTQMAGLDASSAQAQLQLAALRAKLRNQLAGQANDIVLDETGTPRFSTRQDARGKRAYTPPGASTNVSLNTQKDLYGTLAEKLAPEYTGLYTRALQAPSNILTTRRLKGLIDKEPYTGAGATWKLAIGKAAKALGFDYAKEDIKNTELLVSGLGQQTLDAIAGAKLGTGQGFTDKDLKFLENVALGKITYDKGSIQEVLRLREKAERETAKLWNATYGRLDPAQLKILGMIRVDTPDEEIPVAPPAAREAQQEGMSAADDELPTWAPKSPDDEMPARAPPEAEALLRQNPTPQMKRYFMETFKYLPDGL